MTLWLQNFCVILAIGACVVFLARSAWNTLMGKRSKLGACCSKGCDAHEAPRPGERIQFIPVEMLGRKK